MSIENTLKVIGFGFPRTGTMSLKHALEMLGLGPCYHMIEVFHRPADAAFWLDAWQKQATGASLNSIDWGSVFREFQSTTDCPASGFWKPLLNEYPDANYILTERDPEAWYTSFHNTVFQAMIQPEKSADKHRDVQVMAKTLILDGLFEGRFAEKKFAIEKLQDYSRQIRMAVPSDRLLVMDISEGWKPLCQFLGLQIPTEKFPCSNTQQDFQNRLASGRMTDLSGS